jgi:hypothetical protein
MVCAYLLILISWQINDEICKRRRIPVGGHFSTSEVLTGNLSRVSTASGKVHKIEGIFRKSKKLVRLVTVRLFEEALYDVAEHFSILAFAELLVHIFLFFWDWMTVHTPKYLILLTQP